MSNWRLTALDSMMQETDHIGGLQFTDLPEFIIEKITKNYLSAKSVAALASTCKFCYLICSNDTLWKRKCNQDYTLELRDCTPLRSFKELYTKFLYHWGWLLGFWYLDVFPFGGLVKIKFIDGKIIGEQFEVPRPSHAHDSLTRSTVFRLKMSEPCHGVEVQCVIQKEGELVFHEAELKCDVFGNDQSACDKPHFLGKEFKLTCRFKQLHHDMLQDGNVYWGILVFGNEEQPREACFRKIHLNNSISSRGQFRQGIFKGDYGGHGIELIYVHERDGKLEGLKISGDPNIPCGKVSFRLKDPRPRGLRDVLLENDVDIEPFGLDSSSRFNCPLGYRSRVIKAPDYYRECFLGEGQIAHMGYNDPRWIPVIVVIFDENTLGVLWLMLHSLSMYLRVDDRDFQS